MSAKTAIYVLLLLNYGASAHGGDSIESQFLKNMRQITAGMVKAGEGYFSPDGKTIIYQAVPQGYPFYQIYKQPLEAGKPTLVSTGRGRTTCAFFAPTEDKLIFASSHLDPLLSATEEKERKQQEEDAQAGKRRRYQWDFDPQMEIFEADRNGKHLKNLTNSPGYDAEGAYSPDGRLIAFCSDRDGDPDIYLMNADGSNVRQLTNEPGYDGGPFISPDGKWIVYRSDRKREGFLQIHAISLDGKTDVALTDNVGVNWAPYWHPAKPYIIWTGADHADPRARPNYDLWLMKYEIKDGKIAPVTWPSLSETRDHGSESRDSPVTWPSLSETRDRGSESRDHVTRITDHPSADVLPVFSPDGRQLMWTSNRAADKSSQLFIADFSLPDETSPRNSIPKR